MYTRTDLKSRGWSDRLIVDLLGPPDEAKLNPIYRSTPYEAVGARTCRSGRSIAGLPRVSAKTCGSAERAKRVADTKRQDILAAVVGITTPSLHAQSAPANAGTEHLELERVAGKVGVGEAVTAIKRKVYDAIASVHSELAQECIRQAAERGATSATHYRQEQIARRS